MAYRCPCNSDSSRHACPSGLPAEIRAGIDRAGRLSAFLSGLWFFFGPKWRRNPVGTLIDDADPLLDLMERLERREATLGALLEREERRTLPGNPIRHDA